MLNRPLCWRVSCIGLLGGVSGLRPFRCLSITSELTLLFLQLLQAATASAFRVEPRHEYKQDDCRHEGDAEDGRQLHNWQAQRDRDPKE
jgi:hypothetical protein